MHTAYSEYLRSDKTVEAFYKFAGEWSYDAMRDWMWYNFARVNIYFSEAQIVEIVEVRSISVTTLLANIGGAVGLWAGLSVITVVEFVAVPLKLASYYCKRKKSDTGANEHELTGHDDVEKELQK